MFPSRKSFVISEEGTYQKINGKRNITFNSSERQMLIHYKGFSGNKNDDYEKDHDTFFYGGNIIRFQNSEMNKIYINWDLKNQIMTGDNGIDNRNIPMYQDVKIIGNDNLCPIKYERLYFGNFVIPVGEINFMIHIMHPVNSSPLTNDPRRQLCIYISANKKFNPFIEPLGILNGEFYYPVIHKHELGLDLYNQLIEKLSFDLGNNLFKKNIMFNKKNTVNSDLKIPETVNVNGTLVKVEKPMDIDSSKIRKRKVSVLGAQTIESCSMLWMHIHVILDCDISNNQWDYNTHPLHLTSYINERKYDW